MADIFADHIFNRITLTKTLIFWHKYIQANIGLGSQIGDSYQLNRTDNDTVHRYIRVI